MKKQIVTAAISSEREGRPAAVLVQRASSFASNIYMETENKKLNAKSIMGMMTLDFASGQEITISAEGEDEEQAILEMANFLTGEREK